MIVQVKKKKNRKKTKSPRSDCRKDGLMRKQMREFAEIEFSLDTKDRFNLSRILLKSETRGYLLAPSSRPPFVVARTHARLFSPLQCSTRPRGVCSLFKRAYSLPRKST